MGRLFETMKTNMSRMIKTDDRAQARKIVSTAFSLILKPFDLLPAIIFPDKIRTGTDPIRF
jgi:hypothetical protein